MKTAAGVVAVLAWGGLLAAMWYPLVSGVQPPLGAWLGVAAVSLFVGLVVPAFLLSLEGKPPAPARPNVRGPFIRSTPKRDE